MLLHRRSVVLLALALGACTTVTSEPVNTDLDAPSDLRYELIPSGNPDAPSGVLLTWAEPNDSRVTNYVVYSRASSSASWSRRAETTSSSFHDVGIPDLQYEVTSEDRAGAESGPSNTITVDERNQMAAPAALSAITLSRAVQLQWSASARLAEPSLFAYYRVYSAVYDQVNHRCPTSLYDWMLEGTTVSEDFLSTGLTNGVSICFAVTTVSYDGHESLWSDVWMDTPRYDARNVLVDVYQVTPATSGFRFYDAATQTFGVVGSGTWSGADIRVERDTSGTVYLVPMRSDVTSALYSADPVTDLTSIDIAPLDNAFEPGRISAVPGYAYVWRMTYPDGVHYGAIRVTHVGKDYIIFDWSYQSSVNNPELSRPILGLSPAGR